MSEPTTTPANPSLQDPAVNHGDGRDPGPGALLDAIRAHPAWTDSQREAALDRIVSDHDARAICAAVVPRLNRLEGADGETLLRLVEAYPEPGVVRALGKALEAQADLPPERAWQALTVLENVGAIADFPGLAERLADLQQLFEEDDGSIAELADQIENDRDGLWLALQGMHAVEPEVRTEIIAGLAAGEPHGDRLIEFFRLLAYAHEPQTRDAALAALDADPTAAGEAWYDIATHHFDRAVIELSRRRLVRSDHDTIAAAGPLANAGPGLVRSLVSPVDRDGRGMVVLQGSDGRQWATAVFVCDVMGGVVEVFGDLARSPASAERAFDEFASRLGGGGVADAFPLALGLLGGSLSRCGPGTSPALRFWLEATAGRNVWAGGLLADLEGVEPWADSMEDVARAVRDVLDACPDWVDASPLTFSLAEEIVLRGTDVQVDAKRDAGAYRFFFEHRLRDELERYRRMLLWMAAVWRAEGATDLSRAALGLATQLSEAQNVVPGHPFAVALTTRSLAAACGALRGGAGRGGEV